MQSVKLRARQRLGKYRIVKRLALGPYASVYEAMDTIEGQRVALKLPNKGVEDPEFLEDFKREVRLAARLQHPHILPLKDASFIGEQFVIVTPLGGETIESRLKRRVSTATCMVWAEQLLDAMAYAHGERVLHCDIKPANLILFDELNLVLADFGIAKTARRTVKASGSGTLGYVAPEQAMGRPSMRSDVFAAGLVLYRMFAGVLPEWPFRWPPAGLARLRERVPPSMVDLLQRALQVEPGKRFRDGQQMYNAFQEVRKRWQRERNGRRPKTGSREPNWRNVRFREFQKAFGKVLETRQHCGHCAGPVSEAMHACPWCGSERRRVKDATRYPAECPKCRRGVKLDWNYCAWCYSPRFEVETTRQFPDKRYTHDCAREQCGGPLMPFMTYCPWCHAKTDEEWDVPGTDEHCANCGWGTASEYWRYCPWCAHTIGQEH